MIQILIIPPPFSRGGVSLFLLSFAECVIPERFQHLHRILLLQEWLLVVLIFRFQTQTQTQTQFHTAAMLIMMIMTSCPMKVI